LSILITTHSSVRDVSSRSIRSVIGGNKRLTLATE